MWLDPIPAELRDRAMECLDAGDVLGFLMKADNVDGLELVAYNAAELQIRGVYEEALLDAFISTRTNNARWPMRELAYLFESADRTRLKAAGSQLPPTPTFTLYRGVSGRGPARRVRGFSWTSSQERARWFAVRFPHLHDPAVYTATVNEADILAYVNERSEEEFIVDLPRALKIERTNLVTGSHPSGVHADVHAPAQSIP